MVTYVAAAAGAMALLQVVLMVQLARAQRTMSRTGRRLEQLTAALELLTDTTESGFVNVAAELERVAGRPLATTTSRKATARRILTATKRGHSVETIAAEEGVSESEVRLHLGMQDAAREAEAIDDPPQDEDAGVLADLEHWMTTLRRRRTPSRGPRHAAVRV